MRSEQEVREMRRYVQGIVTLYKLQPNKLAPSADGALSVLDFVLGDNNGPDNWQTDLPKLEEAAHTLETLLSMITSNQ